MTAQYTFLPWMRRGLANQIKDPAGAGVSRARLDVAVTVGSDAPGASAAPVVKPIQLVGPGDITGINPRQIIRTEPRAGTSDFEPNYLAAVDLYDEDFPWRYSPFPVDSAAHRLTPWIVLLVLKDDEFERMKIPGRPSPAIKLTAKARKTDIFPVIGQEHAWAHVHLNAAVGSNTTPDLPQLKSLLDGNPDAAYARLVCPRKLDANTGYTGFIVPALDVGRRAGLGEAVVDTDDGSLRSWAGGAIEFPLYYEWHFRTGVDGDFELLVRALVPRDMDPRVGARDMDISRPGFGVAQASNPPDDRVSLEGALLAPTTTRRGLSSGSDFAPQVAAVINAPADALDAPPPDEIDGIGASDPVVAPPIYGSWHAGVERVKLPAEDPGWVSALNLDPRYRASGGLGARVVRKHQDQYMRAAWEQIGDVLTINAKIRRGQLAAKAAYAAYAKTLVRLDREHATALASPVFSKVMGSPTTLHALTLASRLPRAALSPAFRKMLRPRGRWARRMLPPDARRGAITTLVRGINDGSLSAAPPPPPPDGATLEGVTAAIRPPAWLAWLLRHAWWLAVLLGLLVLLAWPLLGGSLALAGALVAGVAGIAGILLGVAYAVAVQRRPALQAAELLSPSQLTPEATVAVPPRPDYTYTAPSDDPLVTVAGVKPSLPGADSADAADMRRALSDYHQALAVRVPAPPARPPLDLAHVHATAVSALEPHTAFAFRFAPLLRVGDEDVVAFEKRRYGSIGAIGAIGAIGGPRRVFREVMYYPDIKDPMYFPLSKISDEYFVPNLGLIPNNTISLMKTNQEFIESYLVGLNHELARELLWNEYPTDMQGSYFRQFWDVSVVPNREGKEAKQFAEDLKDIPRLHQWGRASELGSHNQRDAQGDKSQVVLVVRGDLLKRYPNTILYAQQATWSADPRRKNRLALSDETGELYVNHPKDQRLRFPLYRAFVPPDIHFIGFDLTLAEVKGHPALDETAEMRAKLTPAQLGWFFVLQEMVGEPRFGLDVKAPIEPATPPSWNDLSWVNVDLSGGQCVDLAKKLVGASNATREEGTKWGANAADMAYVLYQEPVMVGIHGRRMLENLVVPT
jgi:hypothetical protein